jgi:hypothetical protein
LSKKWKKIKKRQLPYLFFTLIFADLKVIMMIIFTVNMHFLVIIKEKCTNLTSIERGGTKHEKKIDWTIAQCGNGNIPAFRLRQRRVIQ